MVVRPPGRHQLTARVQPAGIGSGTRRADPRSVSWRSSLSPTGATITGMSTPASRRFVTAASTRWTVLGVVFLWGVFQSTWNLFAANHQTDEPAYQQAAWGYVHGDLTGNLQHPPTAKWLMGLAELAFGDTVEVARIPVVVLSVLAGVVVFLWLREDRGWYTGVLGAGMWWVLPRAIVGDPSRIDRLALLDGPMAAFAVAALWCAWRWAAGPRSGWDSGRSGIAGHWAWVLAAGVLMGLSVTSKEASAVMLPVFVVLPVLFGRWWALLWGGLVFAAAFAVTFVAVYLPFGAVRTVEYMITFQSHHDDGGHNVVVAGQVDRFPPWWANLWFERAGTGAVLSALLAVAVLLAILLRPGRLVLVLVLTTACFLVFFLVVARVALGEYYFAWTPFVTLLAAIGIDQVARSGPARAGRILAAVLVAGLLATAVQSTVTTAHIRRVGLGRVQGVLDARGRPHARILSFGFAPSAVSGLFGDRVQIDPGAGPFQAVIVGDDPRYPVPATATAFLHQDAGQFRRIRLDTATLYLPKGEVVRAPDGGLEVEQAPSR
ncbi:hypothetical protein DEI86_07650 [Curtobacterium sp. MCBD17_028]|nr:hypothetical protein DEI86_07650 [Curtobacterium sp. MCBD17_028]